MKNLREKIKEHAKEADVGWGVSYGFFSKVIRENNLRIGAEIGVAFGGHSEAILKNTNVEKLYGIDPYQHTKGYEDPMNLSQEEFDELYNFTLNRLAPFGKRYEHILKSSNEAVNNVPDNLEFVYIDGDHSYQGVWQDLCAWFSKVMEGGIIGGHDYDHPSHPGVKRAVDEFFRRFDWPVHLEGEGVWWVKKKPLHISFFIPVYNYEKVIRESVGSIMDSNFEKEDELILVNDCSTDNTEKTLKELKIKYPAIRIFNHLRNRGGAAARNTAVENAKNSILFCLDADNILVPQSIKKLKDFLINSGADAAAFQELHYFQNNTKEITGKWKFKQKKVSLIDYLSTTEVPGSSGNYMFTKESWRRAGGYPEENWLDAWGFGLRQAATGSKMVILPNSHYYHRYGHESYWTREHRKGKTSLTAFQVLIPFLDLIDERDVDYIMSRRGRYVWLERLDKHPLRLAKNPGRERKFYLKMHHFPENFKEFLKKKLPYLANIYRKIRNGKQK